MPKSLEAEEFVLRDSRGQVRAVLGTAQNATATMLQIFGENGKPRTRLTVASDGSSSLEVIDSGERVRVLVGVKDNGAPRIWLGNEAGKIVWRAARGGGRLAQPSPFFRGVAPATRTP